SFKGFTEPQKVYILFERKDITDTLYDNRLVGRDDEIARLGEFVSPIYEAHAVGHGTSPGMLVI
ncbi:MAG: hypothetical protein GWO38_05060, partial [Phycisphaerae bacterium]|nr:hypothetical protein [Phycisphaerae bacterium]NIX27009.1 hypothetical protein [Phycisphaerae bacterium]